MGLSQLLANLGSSQHRFFNGLDVKAYEFKPITINSDFVAIATKSNFSRKNPSHPLSHLGITYEIKPGIFDEKRGNAALLIKNSGFYFIFNP